ncbi:hypothetical protein BDV26DRAFT_279512 [Aspergillus bertholletiae]|uniref:Acyl-CoA desaturase n=1 Tax=Aspergillus bertholletiae TaxID=1226010 RepID=A0A5N7BF93_9EURO|nr:hypothetical protein BDV26DRAFT_279512 [Aspergillus bertholletiae]
MSQYELRWYQRIQWAAATVLIILPMLTLCLIPWTPLNKRTLLFSWGYAHNTGICITAGYHRLWSHQSYNASWPLKLYLAIFGAAAMEGPILWWARKHRAHHRYTDTDEDPYSVKDGLLHAHFLWIVFKQRRRTRYVDSSDLEADPIVQWQYRHFPVLAILMGWVFPMVIIGVLFEDWIGGFVYGAILKMVYVHHSTFCINSLAHSLGERPYDDRATPCDNLFASLLTMGEGYHNFHHTFPSDYRNGVRWYQYDCTKWVIAIWEKLGLAYELKRVQQTEIERARLQELGKALTQQMKVLPQGEPLQSLPVMGWSEYQQLSKNGKAMVALDGIIHDVSGFIAEHPGGQKLMQGFIGKDATAAFNGGIYSHSKVARNILPFTRSGSVNHTVVYIKQPVPS